MTQEQAVKQIMQNLGGAVTLKTIYEHLPDIPDCIWRTKTPEASVRRIVQTSPDIIRLKAGVYILKQDYERLINDILMDQIPIPVLMERINSIPSIEAKYDIYSKLNTLLKGSVWDKYSDQLYSNICNTQMPTSITFNGSVGQVIPISCSIPNNK